MSQPAEAPPPIGASHPASAEVASLREALIGCRTVAFATPDKRGKWPAGVMRPGKDASAFAIVPLVGALAQDDIDAINRLIAAAVHVVNAAVAAPTGAADHG